MSEVKFITRAEVPKAEDARSGKWIADLRKARDEGLACAIEVQSNETWPSIRTVAYTVAREAHDGTVGKTHKSGNILYVWFEKRESK
jgi:hypothetical protein